MTAAAQEGSGKERNCSRRAVSATRSASESAAVQISPSVDDINPINVRSTLDFSKFPFGRQDRLSATLVAERHIREDFMKISQTPLMSTALLAAALFGATNSRAETVVIPYSAALQGNQGEDDPIHNCKPNLNHPGQDYRFTDFSDFDCRLDFPLTVPVGHTIQQIFVIHGNDVFDYASGAIEAKLVAMNFQPPVQTTTTMFDWISSGSLLIDTHPLMAQVGKLYLDQFQVLPNTAYEVEVTLSSGGQVSAVAVTYN
jgi:hypothetical protein